MDVRVEVASWSEAGEILGSDKCADVSLLISIGEAHDPVPAGYENVDEKLRLTFSDTTDASGATEDDVQQIIDAAEEVARQGGRVLTHCAAGVSRSSAAALIVYAVVLGPGREEEALRRVMQQRPIARPNRRMIEMADRLLERDGALAAVI
jgi:predicted protein tyrosine phosphatase